MNINIQVDRSLFGGGTNVNTNNNNIEKSSPNNHRGLALPPNNNTDMTASGRSGG